MIKPEHAATAAMLHGDFIDDLKKLCDPPTSGAASVIAFLAIGACIYDIVGASGLMTLVARIPEDHAKMKAEEAAEAMANDPQST